MKKQITLIAGAIVATTLCFTTKTSNFDLNDIIGHKWILQGAITPKPTIEFSKDEVSGYAGRSKPSWKATYTIDTTGWPIKIIFNNLTYAMAKLMPPGPTKEQIEQTNNFINRLKMVEKIEMSHDKKRVLLEYGNYKTLSFLKAITLPKEKSWHVKQYGKKENPKKAISGARISFDNQKVTLSYTPKPATSQTTRSYSSNYKIENNKLTIEPLSANPPPEYGLQVIVRAPGSLGKDYEKMQYDEIKAIKELLEQAESFEIIDNSLTIFSKDNILILE